MASAYGHRREYREWVNPYDVQLTAQVQAYRQQNHDANFEKIQSLIDQYGAMDLYKDEDKMYLYSRLQTITDELNRKGTMKLDSKGVERELEGLVRNSIDDKVLTAFQMTQQARKTLSDIAEAKKLGSKGGYSEVNEMEALEPIRAWAKDGQVGSTFVNRGYTKYVDYKKELGEKLTELYKDSERTFDVPTKDGRYKRTTVKGMSESEINLYASSMMSDEAKRQQQLDAKWRVYKQSSPDQIQSSFNQSIDNSITEFQSQLNNEKDKNSDNAVYLKSQISNLNQLKSKYGLSSADDEETKTQKSIAQANYLQHNADISGFQHAFRQRAIKEIYETNQAYWNRARMEFDREQKALDRNLKIDEINAGLFKEGLKYDAKTRTILNADGSDPTYGDPGLKGIAKKTALDANDQANAVDFFQNRLSNLINESSSTVNELIGKLPPNLKTAFNNYMENNPESNEYVKKRVSLEAVIKNNMTDEDLKTFAPILQKMDDNKQRLNDWWDKDREVVKNAAEDVNAIIASKISGYDKMTEAQKARVLSSRITNILTTNKNSLSSVNKKALIHSLMSQGGRVKVDEADFAKITSQGATISRSEWMRIGNKYPELGKLFNNFGYLGKNVYGEDGKTLTHKVVNFIYSGSANKDGTDYLTSQGLKNYSQERLSNLYYQGGATSFTMPTLFDKQNQSSPPWTFVSSFINGELNTQGKVYRNGELVDMGNGKEGNAVRDRLLKAVGNSGATITMNKEGKFIVQLDGYELVGDMTTAYEYASRPENAGFAQAVLINADSKSGGVEPRLDINSTSNVRGAKDFRKESYYTNQAGNVLRQTFGEKLLEGGETYKRELKGFVVSAAPALQAMNVDAKKMYDAIDTFVDKGMMGQVFVSTAPADANGNKVVLYGLKNGNDAIVRQTTLDGMSEDMYSALRASVRQAPQVLAYQVAEETLKTQDGIQDFVKYLKGLGVDVTLKR